VSKKRVWAGRILSSLPVLLLLFSGVMKLVQPPELATAFAHLGYPETLALPIGILEIACTIVYIIPQTSALGAVLLTGYLGGATATHVRVGDPFLMPVILGVLVWGGLYLRDPRLRVLLPFRN
jgi:uncharacterized membrane protein YphA (DoxX/SURF4 family)